MASAIPQALLGKNVLVTAVTLIPNTTTGVIATGTSTVSFYGVLSASNPLSVQNSVTKAEWSNMDNPYDNKYIIQQGSSMTITEMLQAGTPSVTADANTGITVNGIEKLASLASHFLITVVWKDNAGTTKRTNTGRWQYNGHGEQYAKAPGTMGMNLETFSSMTGGAYDAPIILS